MLQEYVNHNGSLYKVYAIGSEIQIVKKSSLPNLRTDFLTTDVVPSIAFDSQKMDDTIIPDWVRSESANDASHLGGEKGLCTKEISCVIRSIQECLGLSLLGVDIVRDVRGQLLIVDVNYFPSYRGFPSVPAAFDKLLSDCARQVGREVSGSGTIDTQAKTANEEKSERYR